MNQTLDGGYFTKLAPVHAEAGRKKPKCGFFGALVVKRVRKQSCAPKARAFDTDWRGENAHFMANWPLSYSVSKKSLCTPRRPLKTHSKHLHTLKIHQTTRNTLKTHSDTQTHSNTLKTYPNTLRIPPNTQKHIQTHSNTLQTHLNA